MNESRPNRTSKSRQGISPTGRVQIARVSQDGVGLDPETRRNLIAETAYYLAEGRQFQPGLDLANWLEAERQIDAGVILG
jgi:hypothetical protein